MKKIKRALLATDNLKQLFETHCHWYQKTVDEVLSTQIQAELCFEEQSILTENELLKLCKKKLHSEAAKKFIDTTLYDEDDEPIIPLLWAIERNDLELTICLLALGVNVNQSNDDWSRYPLTVAMQLSDNTIFNLLLLHPAIDVNISGAYQSTDSDIMEFCGIYSEGEPLIPCTILLSLEYQACYLWINIDWNMNYGNDERPLMYLFFESYDFQSMSRLVEFGAEVNPDICQYFDEYRSLLLEAIDRYYSSKTDRNIERVKWFAKYSAILEAEDYEGGSLYEYLIREQPIDEQLIEIFKLGKIKAFYDQAEENEKEFEITQQKDIESILQSTHLFDGNHQNYHFDVNVSQIS